MTLNARLIGYPRVGPRRELKWTLESAWAGKLGSVELEGRHPE